LGVKLFQRSNHSIHLTEDGMLLKRRAQEIVALTDKTEKEFQHKEDSVSGEISIGSGETKSVHELAEMLSLFREEYPAVSYDFYTANADDIKERLDKGLLDIGLLTEPVDISKYNFIRLKGRERWGILVQEDSALAAKECVKPEDLLETPLLMVRRPLVQNELAGWFDNYYDQIHIVGTYNLINNAAVMVEKGIGCALCFNLGVTFDKLRFVPLLPAVETGAVIVWKKNQIASQAVYRFIDFLKKYKMSISED
ncbi:MAG: LysR family transcriptional regulator, partial [Agathobacter sp.]